jgi:hypothetical protein
MDQTSGDIPADRLGDRKLSAAERHEYRNRALFEKAAVGGYFILSSLDEWAIQAGLPFLFSRALPWDGEGEYVPISQHLIHYSILFLKIGPHFAANAHDVAIKHYAQRLGGGLCNSKDAAALVMNVEITDRVLNAVFDGDLTMCDSAGFPIDVTADKLAYEECPERFLRDADVRQLLGLYSAGTKKGDSDLSARDTKNLAGLESPEIRRAFGSVKGQKRKGSYVTWDQDQWISMLKDPPKWLEPARLLRGKRGKPAAVWDPVLVAKALGEERGVWPELDSAFQGKTLEPWHERWLRESKKWK